MTHIPGTSETTDKSGEVTPSDKKEEGSTIDGLRITNTRDDLKKKDKTNYQEGVWYFQLKYWLIFGSLPSVVFLIISIFNPFFLWIVPLTPLAAYVSWHVRRIVLKNAKKFDAFS